MPPPWAALVLFAAGCAHRVGSTASVPAWRERPGAAESRFYYYGNDRGLTVLTAGAIAEQPVSRNVALTGQLLVDHIVVETPGSVHEDTGNQPTGHMHTDVDIVTSASVTVLGGDRLEKTRYEGTLGTNIDTSIRGAPTRFQPSARVSIEPDYQSYSGRLRMTTELFERNTTLSGFVGFGHDRIDPLEAPMGDADRWPATHDRINGGVSVSQILSPRLVLAGGFGLNYMFGNLSSPYRRALVRTTLFPEILPTTRARGTLYTTLAWYLGWDTALHLRFGTYLDSWGVKAVIPQAAVTKDFSETVLVTLQYRFYWQTAAAFYAFRYDDLEPERTGDQRLGGIHEHQPGLEVAWTFLGQQGDFGSLTARAGYRLSLIEYRDLERFTIGHIALVGFGGSY